MVESKEFSNLTGYFISKINSPYKEIEYVIQNNDSIEKILRKININVNDIKIISNNLKQKKLTNIYSGRTLSLVLKVKLILLLSDSIFVILWLYLIIFSSNLSFKNPINLDLLIVVYLHFSEFVIPII